MTWLTWRQFRANALTAVGVLAAAAVILLVTGLHMHHIYAGDLTSCARLNGCGDLLDRFQQHYNAALNITEVLLIAAPGLIGLFWGAPLVSREFETGTHQLVWNQTVSRTRWLTVKLAGIGAASILTVGLLSYLLTWWAGPLDHINGSRFAATTFASRDIVPLGYAAFAFALGTATGLLLRRTIPAMAVTLGLFIGIQVLMPTVIRPHLLASTTVSYPINRSTAARVNGLYTSGGGAKVYLAGLPVPRGAWVLSSPPIENAANDVIPAYRYNSCLLPPPTGLGKEGGPTPATAAACLTPDHLHEAVTYQPASHYWPLQWYETGIFAAPAATLSGICFWRIRRRQS